MDETETIMFGFGKALDVLRDGGRVRRTNPPMTGSLALEPRAESDTGNRVMLPWFVWTTDPALDTTYVLVWSPTHADLLAEDWDYA